MTLAKLIVFCEGLWDDVNKCSMADFRPTGEDSLVQVDIEFAFSPMPQRGIFGNIHDHIETHMVVRFPRLVETKSELVFPDTLAPDSANGLAQVHQFLA